MNTVSTCCAICIALIVSSSAAWAWPYGSPQNDVEPTCVVTAGADEVFLGGASSDASQDFASARLDDDGSELWLSEFDEANDDDVEDVAVATGGSLAAAGRVTISGGFNPTTALVAFLVNPTTGAEIWRRTISGTGSSNIHAGHAVTALPSGDVAVAGRITNLPAVVRLDAATGNTVWQFTLAEWGWFVDVTADAAGDVYAVGEGVSSRFVVTRIDATAGTETWKTSIATVGAAATAVALDASGDVLVAGTIPGTGFNIVKLAGSDGMEIWRTSLELDATPEGEAVAVAVDSTGDVIAAGSVVVHDGGGSPIRNELAVLKVDGSTGVEDWHVFTNHSGNTSAATALAVLSADDVVVTIAGTESSEARMGLLRLAGATGAESWRRIDSGELLSPGTGSGAQRHLAIDGSGDIVVAGVPARKYRASDGVPLDVCGNGLVETGEQCDDGNETNGDCCSATCTIETGACTDDGDPCTTDICVAEVCTHTPHTGSCDDGIFCNGADTCVLGVCEHAGDPCAGGAECNAVCNETFDFCFDDLGTPCTSDGNPCTEDVCDGGGTCAHFNDDLAPCDDGLFCNGDDVCFGGVCQHTGDPCDADCLSNCDEVGDTCQQEPAGTPCTDDGNDCTTDECDAAGTCIHDPASSGTVCQDGDACTGPDQCDGAGTCVAGPDSCGCCDVHAAPGCNDPLDCNNCVCGRDSYCCTDEWDDLCVRIAEHFCNALCPCGTATACPGGSDEPGDCLDDLVCYKTKTTKGAPKFGGVDNFELDFDIFVQHYSIKKPAGLCAPAFAPSGAYIDEQMHYEAYKGKASGSRFDHAMQTTDSFGTWDLQTVKSQQLLIPTGKELGTAATAPAAETADFYGCWKVKVVAGPDVKGAQLTRTDQFDVDRVYDVKKLKLVCRPMHPFLERYVNPVTHFMCYQVKSAKGQAKHVPVVGVIHTANRFGDERLDTKGQQLLCLPATRDDGGSP